MNFFKNKPPKKEVDHEAIKLIEDTNRRVRQQYRETAMRLRNLLKDLEDGHGCK